MRCLGRLAAGLVTVVYLMAVHLMFIQYHQVYERTNYKNDDQNHPLEQSFDKNISNNRHILNDNENLNTLIKNKNNNERDSIATVRNIAINKINNNSLINLDKLTTYMRHLKGKRNFTSEEVEFLQQWRSVLQSRQTRVEEVCLESKHKRRNLLYGYDSFMMDTKRHIAYCKNAKAGSSSWMKQFLEWSGVSTYKLSTDNLHDVAKAAFPPPVMMALWVEVLKKPFKFTVVRHPFTRLASAYRDKIPKDYKKYGHKFMIERFRKDKSYNSTIPTFREFALFAAQQVVTCSKDANSDLCVAGEIDIHWQPYYLYCSPCDITYDVISKMETFENDKRFISLVTGLKTPTSKSSIEANKSPGPATQEITRQYLATLTKEELDTLYQAYYYDFIMFGYSPKNLDGVT